jgi:hypothetical protein
MEHPRMKIFQKKYKFEILGVQHNYYCCPDCKNEPSFNVQVYFSNGFSGKNFAIQVVEIICNFCEDRYIEGKDIDKAVSEWNKLT